ncbi:aspartyl-tRNA amidotransferase subunit B [Betaproteobacteria bacterium]|nr:aspartyl-tRNA amidotransferase subunit B [Betaproteobacteria bacterium]
MTLKERINEDMKAALRARETAKLGAIRLLMAAIKQREVDERIVLDDAAVVAVIDKMLKQRRDSIAQFQAAGRQDLVDAEKLEADLLQTYMPAGLSGDEIRAAVAAAVAETGVAGPGDMGKVMAALKPRLAGRADMAEVSKLVKAALTQTN